MTEPIKTPYDIEMWELQRRDWFPSQAHLIALLEVGIKAYHEGYGVGFGKGALEGATAGVEIAQKEVNRRAELFPELVEAAEEMVKAVRAFASSEMSRELSALLYLATSPCQEDVGRYVIMCEETDKVSTIVKKARGEADA